MFADDMGTPVPQEQVQDTEQSNVPEIVAFLDSLKEKKETITDTQIIAKLMDLSKIHFDKCWEARLPQTAEAEFNNVCLAFNILQKMLLVRHGARAVPATPPQVDSPRIIL